MKNIERFLWLAVLTTCAAVLLSFGAREAGFESSVTLFWCRWILVFALPIGLSAALLGWLGDTLTGLSFSSVLRWLAGLVIGILVFYFNGRALLEILGIGAESTGDAGSALVLIVVLAASVLTVVLGQGSSWWYRGASMVALGLFAWWIWPSGEAPEASAASLPAVQGNGQRLLVIGLDGADWQYVDPLIARGELPNLQRLVETGVSGPLATMRPTLSPALWTTVVTGKRPEDHGIRGHALIHAKGGRQAMPKPKHLAKGFGLTRLYEWLFSRGEIVRSPATSLQRRVPAFWNITTAFDSPLDVVNWWATWPAEAILGRMVTDRTYFWRWAARGFSEVDEAITFPDTLYKQLAPLVMRPDEVTLADAQAFMDIDATAFAAVQDSSYQHHELLSEFKYYYSMFETHRRFVDSFFARAEAEGVTPSDMMVIFRLVDMLSHSSLQYSELVEDHLGNPPEDVQRFSRAVTEAYRRVDAEVGAMISAFGEGNVVVISDHGFKLEGKKRKKRYDHKSGPSGIFVASGPVFGQGQIEDLSLFHVLPILLAVKGFPVPTDIVAEVPVRAFAPEFLAQDPTESIDTYGTVELRAATSDSAVDEEMIERLEALGYLD